MDSSLNGVDLGAQVCISDWTRRDLDWWRIALPVGNGGRIPNTDMRHRPGAVRLFTDAAGGSLEFSGRGVGMAIFPNTWAQVLHRHPTNSGLLGSDGKSLACKLSVWELVGPLLAMASALEKFRNKQVVAYVDNVGSVIWWEKGWAKG